MNRTVKGDLIDYVVDAIPTLTKKEASNAIDLLFQKIADDVACGDAVAIRGFGTFEPRKHRARMGRNMRTGEPMPIAERTVMAFKPAKSAVKS